MPVDRPVIDSSTVLNWPDTFRRRGNLEVNDGNPLRSSYDPVCWFSVGNGVSQYCLRRCFEILGTHAVIMHIVEGCLIMNVNDSSNSYFDTTPDSYPQTMHPLKNFTVWSDIILSPIKTLKPTVTIKMPLLNLTFSDHAKLCLSFCALHPDCRSCSVFPNASLQVDQALDRVVGVVDQSREALSCLLFLRRGDEEYLLDGVRSNGAISFLSTEANLEIEP